MASKRTVQVGRVTVGGGAPVAVQSMTTTQTNDPKATLAQIQELFEEADSGTEAEQVEKMKEAAKVISEDAAADFLFLLPNLMVAEPDITGLPENMLTDSFPLADLARD